MANQFKLLDQVQWTSRGGATSKTKEGVIELVVPAGKPLPQALAKEADAYGLPRDHESYLVRVGKTATRKGKLYWPQAKDLQAINAAPLKLTEKQLSALRDAKANGGRIFQLPERRTHSPVTLAALVKAGLLVKLPVGVYWALTPKGDEALQRLSAEQIKKS